MGGYSFFANGSERQALSGATFERRSPFDGAMAGVFANADASDAQRVIAEARVAFDSGPWGRSVARQRYELLDGIACLLSERIDEFAERMVRESGKPVTLARSEVQSSIRTLQYYAGAALSMEGSAINERNLDALGLILHEPIGVAGLITAWNFPLLGIVCKLAPALAAGCTVVAKPSHLCPGPGVLLAQAVSEAGAPDGVFNVITSDIDRGAAVGQALAGSEMIDKIAFTGSTASGRAVMRAAAGNNKRVALELGGKSANIVFEDAPFEDAARTALAAFTFNSGQQCSAGSRLLVQRSIHDQFVEAVVAHANAVKLGDPADPATVMGPLVSEEQQRRVLDYVAIGRAEGEIVAGGSAPDGPALANGYFVSPTIVDRVENDARIAQEEVFGPVLAVIAFEDEADAVAKANASPYGLAGGVWTSALTRAVRVAKAVRTGKMFVNSYNSAGIDDMPHGGYKASGVGREFGASGLEEFQQLKTIQIKLV